MVKSILNVRLGLLTKSKESQIERRKNVSKAIFCGNSSLSIFVQALLHSSLHPSSRAPQHLSLPFLYLFLFWIITAVTFYHHFAYVLIQHSPRRNVCQYCASHQLFLYHLVVFLFDSSSVFCFYFTSLICQHSPLWSSPKELVITFYIFNHRQSCHHNWGKVTYPPTIGTPTVW